MTKKRGRPVKAGLWTFRGLPGVKAKWLHGPCVRSPSAVIIAMRAHRICSCGGDGGSITIWRDDDGALRGAFSRYLRSVDEQTFSSVAQCKAWLKTWWPRMANFEVPK